MPQPEISSEVPERIQRVEHGLWLDPSIVDPLSSTHDLPIIRASDTT
jgi:hypothetical protein